MRPVALLIMGWPLAEIAGFMVVADRIGGLNTFLLVVGSAFLGVSVIRRQGLGALMTARERFGGGERAPDLGDLLDGLAVSFAGLLLIIPGFLSDLLGLALLVPGVRQSIGAWLVQNLRPMVFHAAGAPRRPFPDDAFTGPASPPGAGPGGGPGGGDVIDATYTVVDEPSPSKGGDAPKIDRRP